MPSKILFAKSDSCIHQLAAPWREGVEGLVKTDFSSGLLSLPPHWRESFPPCHVNLITPTVWVCFSPHTFFQIEATNVARPCLEENIWTVWSYLSSQTECQPGRKPKLSSDTLQNLGSRGQQRQRGCVATIILRRNILSVTPPVTSSSEDGSLAHGLCVGILMKCTYWQNHEKQAAAEKLALYLLGSFKPEYAMSSAQGGSYACVHKEVVIELLQLQSFWVGLLRSSPSFWPVSCFLHFASWFWGHMCS